MASNEGEDDNPRVKGSMRNQERHGCLTVILRLFGIPLEKTATLELPYCLRDDFLSPAEFSFYRVLQLAVRDQGIVCPKVNLADIFFVSRPNENQAYRNRIDRKHVDFLVCHPRTMKPQFGVELDDKSHGRSDRVERDEFVNEVFQAAGLPLIRKPAKAAYEPQALAAELSSYFAEHVATVAPTPVALSSTSSPICSKCGVPMVQRTASKGQNAGKQFWGCTNYPRCREVA